MQDSEDLSTIVDGTPFSERVEATEEFAKIADRILRVGTLKWSDVEADYRLLAFNSSLRRQLESINAATLLSRNGLGHLAVAFIRAALEDAMYLEFFSQLDLEESQELFLHLGKWDAIRSLLAQRSYVGDDVMAQLWYPLPFLEAAERERETVKTQLKGLQIKYRWSGGTLPSADWIADRAGQRALYDYLHAATSRALHFSAGEILRRGWGHPRGALITDKQEFREHLASFALDQLWRLYTETWKVAIPFLEAAGISSDDAVGWDQMQPVLDRLLAAGKVPLVHAHEWNLTPNGPLKH
ncbi:DUF5677 domain-containing protein [Actinoplanes sp. NPDC026623]|uniref:DUF5677 domain-containing protein n=1 Tax=Actinoplanes sp. NPDC026623 TaxID=3155610 RepID=UPI0033DAE93D